MSEKCAETDSRYRLVPTRKWHHPLFMCAGNVFGDVLPRKLVTIEGSVVHSGKPKWKSRLRSKSPQPRPCGRSQSADRVLNCSKEGVLCRSA